MRGNRENKQLIGRTENYDSEGSCLDSVGSAHVMQKYNLTCCLILA